MWKPYPGVGLIIGRTERLAVHDYTRATGLILGNNDLLLWELLDDLVHREANFRSHGDHPRSGVVVVRNSSETLARADLHPVGIADRLALAVWIVQAKEKVGLDR